MNAPDPIAQIQRAAIDGAVHIPLDLLRASPTNPRKHFDQQHLDELADSIRKHGVFQPILARRIEGAKTGQPLYEVVAGERRWRASKLATQPSIPALLRELTDFEVLELQVIENLQRDDLHPLEEAEGFAALLRKPDGVQGYTTPEELANRIGRSERHVYNRLALLKLVPAAREACLEGKVSASVALYIARLQPDDQPEALKICLTGWGGEPLSARQAAGELERRFMLKLSAAPFKITDASLVPEAGSCRECPKRTGANPELFSDVGSADTCTDSACFNRKTDAHRQRLLDEARAQGLEVITGAAAKKIMPERYSSSMRGYLPLDEVQHSIGDKPLSKLLGKDAPPVTLLENPHTHDVIKVVKADAAMEVLKSKGIVKSSRMPTTSASQRKAEAQAKAATAWRTAAIERSMEATLAVDGQEAAKFAAFLWPEVAIAMWHDLGSDDERRAERLLGWEHIPSNYHDPKGDEKAEARIRGLTMPELGRLLVCLCLVGEAHVGPNTTPAAMGKAPRIARFAQALGISVDDVRKDIAAGAAKPGAKKAKTATEAFVDAHAKPKRATELKPAVKYRDPATGSTWSGRGLQPAWVKAALASGKTLDELLAVAEEQAA